MSLNDNSFATNSKIYPAKNKTTMIADPAFKVVLLGNTGVGKSSLLHRLRYDRFIGRSDPTLGCEFASYSDSGTAKLLIWDTAGQTSFRSFIPNFIKGAKACVVCYDLTTPLADACLDEWMALVREHCDNDVVVALAGTKLDACETRDEAGIEQFTRRERIHISTATSSRTGDGVKGLFRRIATTLAFVPSQSTPGIPSTVCITSRTDATRARAPSSCDC